MEQEEELRGIGGVAGSRRFHQAMLFPPLVTIHTFLLDRTCICTLKRMAESFRGLKP